MASYQDDPRWITAKFAGKDKDGNPFKKGDRVFYFPRTKAIYTGAKAERESAAFNAAKQDEDNYMASFPQY